MEKNLLIIGTVWPEPGATAAGGRMQRLIQFFLEHGCQITFASTATESDLSMDLDVLGIAKKPILLNNPSFDIFLKEVQPDMVLFDRFLMEEQFGWRVVEHAPNALRILDTEDLHSLRKTRETALKKELTWDTDYWLGADITKREIASIYRCDLSLIISSFEMELLQNTLKMDNEILLHLPFIVDAPTEEMMATWPDYKERTDFIFIGTGKHTPNLDAIKWLKDEIWPLIRAELPTVNCHIYGSYLPKQIMQLHKPANGFYLEGEVTDLDANMQSKRINLAPLRFGAGLKGKLLAGMQNGTPNLTTCIGAEGMHDHLPWNGAIADTAEAFAQAAISFYQDVSKWRAAQENGITLLNALYTPTEHKNELLQRLQEITTNLRQHRSQNFVGALIQHQTMASTKYMAKWIEEKNRG